MSFLVASRKRARVRFRVEGRSRWLRRSLVAGALVLTLVACRKEASDRRSPRDTAIVTGAAEAEGGPLTTYVEPSKTEEGPLMTEAEVFAAAAKTKASVFIFGEDAKARASMARRLHDHGPRAGAPFVVVRCSAIPEERLARELFGDPPGQPGVLVAVSLQGGTVFVDEIDSLPRALQLRLLSSVRESRVQLDGSTDIPLDARMVVGTAQRRHIENMVRDETFDPALYDRLGVLQFQLPLRGL